MKILFDGFWWVSGPVSNRQVLREIIHTWMIRYPADEVTVAVRARDLNQAQRELAESSARVVPLKSRPHGIAAIWELPRIAEKTGAEVTITHNFTPRRGSSVVFIHDVLFLTNPEWFTLRERMYFSLMPLSAKRATRILTSSETEVSRIIAQMRPAVPVSATGLAVGRDLLSAPQTRPDLSISPSGYLLTVGRLNVRKNLETTCLAALASGHLSVEFPLVVVGGASGKGMQTPPAVQEAIEDGRIKMLGHVSVGELAWLFANARGFLFMTLGEGFGLPPLEAMNFGTPVLASDIPIMREVLGDLASFANPTDLEMVRDSISNLLASESPNREDLIERAQSKYDWQSVVSRIRAAAVDAASLA